MFRIGRAFVGVSESWAISVVAENSSTQGGDEHSANIPIIPSPVRTGRTYGPYGRTYGRSFSTAVRIARTYGCPSA